MAKKKEADGIPMLMEAPSTGLVVPQSFKIGDHLINRDYLEKCIEEDTKRTITGVNDTAGYKQAIAYRASYRTTRTTLAKVVKEMSQPHKDYVTGLKKASDDLGAIAFKGEEYFDSLITAIDDEKQRIKDEAEKEAQRKLQGRINALTALGAKFDGENYHFDYDENQFVSAFDLPQYSDGEFESVLTDIRKSFEKEEQRIADEKQAKIDADLLIEQQSEQNKKDALALTEKRTKLRVKEITLMGFSDCEGDSYLLNEHIEIDKKDVLSMDDDAWDYLMSDINNLIDQIGAPIPATEPIADVQDTKTVSEVLLPQLEENWYEGIGEAEHVNEPLDIEPDYSLNEFQSWVESVYDKGKLKANVLNAIKEFKQLQEKR